LRDTVKTVRDLGAEFKKYVSYFIFDALKIKNTKRFADKYHPRTIPLLFAYRTAQQAQIL